MNPVKRLFGKTSDDDQLHLADVLRQETVGGVLMLAATVVALLWANLAPDVYHDVVHTTLGPMSLGHWAADGLLAIFFFVAGMELRRELTEGALSSPSNAIVPLVAALAGVALPAAIFVVMNLAHPDGDLKGWAIPVATDIAFALAVLAVVGRNLPGALRSFLLTMAIVDDVIAVLIIAIFFTQSINWLALAGAVAALALWAFLQQRQVTGWYIYLPIALVAWYMTWLSGIHATIAGVALGMLVYCSKTDPNDILDRWEHNLRPVSAGIVVPVFALFAAGVHLTGDVVSRVLTHPVSLGIIAALVVGKLVGVWSGAFVSGSLLDAKPEDARWREVAGIAQLAGIGFTVSLLIAELTYFDHPEMAELAKAAVLAASLLSAILGAVMFAIRGARKANTVVAH